MLYSNGEPCPSHTTNKVPFTVISNHITHELKDGKGLQDIAPTVLKLLGIPKPVIMTGESLI
jgi:2,3-bisphosphoglycerate-independent phosphoglycerate mutase